MSKKIECPFTDQRLQELYWKEAMTLEQIALLACKALESPGLVRHWTVRRWLKSKQILTRNRSERGKVFFRNNPSWAKEFIRIGRDAVRNCPAQKIFASKHCKKIQRKATRAYAQKCRKSRVSYICDLPGCTNTFLLTPSRYKLDCRHFCSLSCNAKYTNTWLRRERKANELRQQGEEVLRHKAAEAFGRQTAVA